MAVPVQQMEPSHQPRAPARARREAAAASREEEEGRPRGSGVRRCPLLSCQQFRATATLSLGRGVCRPLDFLFLVFVLRPLTLLTPQQLVSGNFDDAAQKRAHTHRMTRGGR